jgi:hypothetical protein
MEGSERKGRKAGRNGHRENYLQQRSLKILCPRPAKSTLTVNRSTVEPEKKQQRPADFHAETKTPGASICQKSNALEQS